MAILTPVPEVWLGASSGFGAIFESVALPQPESVLRFVTPIAIGPNDGL